MNATTKQVYASLGEFLDELNENCLLLGRHGETDWNALGLIQGVQDRPLSIRGFQQRKNLFFQLQSVPLSQIYTSDLSRTITTAEPISIEKGVEIKRLPELNEAQLGVFEGEHKVNFADAYSEKIYSDFLKDEINYVLPGGGENLKMVYDRIQVPLNEILSSVSQFGNTLLVGHRNVNKMLIKSLLGLSFEEGYHVEHKNHWLYIFAPIAKQIYLFEIKHPIGKVEIQSGYGQIDTYPTQ